MILYVPPIESVLPALEMETVWLVVVAAETESWSVFLSCKFCYVTINTNDKYLFCISKCMLLFDRTFIPVIVCLQLGVAVEVASMPQVELPK